MNTLKNNIFATCFTVLALMTHPAYSGAVLSKGLEVFSSKPRAKFKDIPFDVLAYEILPYRDLSPKELIDIAFISKEMHGVVCEYFKNTVKKCWERDPFSQYMYARMCVNGIGVPKDLRKAAAFFRRAVIEFRRSKKEYKPAEIWARAYAYKVDFPRLDAIDLLPEEDRETAFVDLAEHPEYAMIKRGNYHDLLHSTFYYENDHASSTRVFAAKSIDDDSLRVATCLRLAQNSKISFDSRNSAIADHEWSTPYIPFLSKEWRQAHLSMATDSNIFLDQRLKSFYQLPEEDIKPFYSCFMMLAKRVEGYQLDITYCIDLLYLLPKDYPGKNVLLKKISNAQIISSATHFKKLERMLALIGE